MSDKSQTDAAGKVLDDLQAVGDAARQVGQQARQAGGEAVTHARDVAQDAQTRGASLTAEVKDRVASVAQTGKDDFAERLKDIAQAVHRSGEQLEGHQDWAASLVERGADELAILAAIGSGSRWSHGRFRWCITYPRCTDEHARRRPTEWHGSGRSERRYGRRIEGLVSSFQQAGPGHIAQSWIGNGQNQPLSPQQLQTVLGDNQVQGMASQAGMGSQDFLSQLSQHLPNVLNGMTPNGRLPDEGSMSV